MSPGGHSQGRPAASAQARGRRAGPGPHPRRVTKASSSATSVIDRRERSLASARSQPWTAWRQYATQVTGQPLRIVVDTSARTPATARVLDGAAPPSHGVSGIGTSAAGLGLHYAAQVLQVGGFAIGALKDGEG
jgi:hypothetical protein